MNLHTRNGEYLPNAAQDKQLDRFVFILAIQVYFKF